MGLIPALKRWFSIPLAPNASLFNLIIYVGILFVVVFLWSTVIQGIGRGMQIIEESV